VASATIGIRREDKNRWERRAPLTPDHVRELIHEHAISVRVEPSPQRAFDDLDYEAAGAAVDSDLGPCRLLFGVKEIPPERVLPQKTYFVFPHVTKGQAVNMPMLRRLMETGCTLIDYELIRDHRDRRLIFFGRHAGYAGMIDTLQALGQRLAWEGFPTPLEELRPTHEYASLDEATAHLARLGDRIRHGGLPAGLRPVVIAILGSGNVSRGAQEICERLPVQEIRPDELLGLDEDRDRPRNLLFLTRFSRFERLRRRKGGGFDAAEYATAPELYESALTPLLPRITALVNGVFWLPGMPRLVNADALRNLWASEDQPKLRVIGDITCDVGGSIEITVRATTPGDPTYVWDPVSGEVASGVAGRGTIVMAVDNLPCELPVEASQHFGDSLVHFVPVLARCDWSAPLDSLAVPEEIRQAIIVHRGELTPRFAYLTDSLE